MVARAGEQTRDLLFSFIFSFHHFTAEPQRLPSWKINLKNCPKEILANIFQSKNTVIVIEIGRILS
jgi:hypothetical protein